MSSVELEAARWFARMQAAHPDHPDRARFEAWLAAHPAHAAEYAAFADLWSDLKSGAHGEALVAIMKERRKRRRSRRTALKRGVAGLLLAVLGGGTLYYSSQPPPQSQLTRHSGIGELKREPLPDGSLLLLGAGTEVEVTYTAAERRVELRRGESIFDIAEDTQRPFVIEAGTARITVLGTRFVVNRLTNTVRVSVDHGRVRVAAGSFWKRQEAVLESGQVAEVKVAGDSGPVLRKLQRRAADDFAFEHGTVMFDQADLAEVAETLSRYRKEPIRVQPPTPGAASPRIVAGVHVTDVEGFINLLPQLAPVAIRREGQDVWLQALEKDPGT